MLTAAVQYSFWPFPEALKNISKVHAIKLTTFLFPFYFNFLSSYGVVLGIRGCIVDFTLVLETVLFLCRVHTPMNRHALFA